VKATAGGGLELKTEVRKRLFGLVLLLSLVVLAAGAGMAGEPSRVVIVPFKMNADRDLSFLKEGIVDMLTSRLSLGKSVVVVSREDTDQALHDVSVPVDEKTARAIGARLRADHVLFGSLTILGNSISLDARMVDVHKKKPTLTFFKQTKEIDEVIPQIDLLASRINETVFGRPVAARQPPAQETERRAAYVHPESLLTGEPGDQTKVSSAPVDMAPAGFWKSKNFKIAIKGLSLGDVDGDSKTEVVFISNRRIYVHRFESQRLVKIWEKAGKRSERFIGIDVADINGNGRAEIFVTSLKGDGQRLDSFVLEWDGDGFRRIGGDPSYYRVIESPEGGKILLGQKRRMDDPFVPGVYQLTWRNGEYVPEERLALPKGINVFGFAIGDVMNNGQQMIVAFDKGDYIRLFAPSGKEEYKTDERYGGSMNYVESWSKGEDVPDRIYLPQRICARDLDGDGRPEVVMASNQGSLGRLFARLRRFENGRIACLSWTDLGLTQIGETRKVSGHISDCAIGDLDNDGTAEVVAVQVAKLGTAVTSARSTIIVYELGRPASER